MGSCQQRRNENKEMMKSELIRGIKEFQKTEL